MAAPPPPPSSSTPNLSLSPPAGAGVALLDLERELTCSICTDILYQPLTCLDCLHTFCGSCLAEWFGWQHARAVAASRRDPRSGRERRGPTQVKVAYTCPSCRAQVRETRPNATVTTLLDMWMAANPGRGKSEAERAEVSKVYVPGKTAVFPSAQTAGGEQTDEDDEDEEDERLVQEVREMSLNEMQQESFGAREQRRGHRERRSARGQSGAATDSTSRGAGQRRGASTEGQATGQNGARRRQAESGRQIEHQSSLRSLLSTSDVDSSDMQEEILRQITEEGLLDGIDLDNIRVEQEDEISERIAQAYRRRQRELQSGRRRAASSQPTARHQRNTSTSAAQDNTPAGQGRVRSRSNVDNPLAAATVMASEAPGDGQRLRPEEANEPVRRAARAATEMSQGRLRRRSQENRRSTEPPTGIRISEQWRRGAAGVSPQPPAMSILDGDEYLAAPAPVVGQEHAVVAAASPGISCQHCDRHHIEFELHYSCLRCSTNTEPYSLCRRCYLGGKGCLYWFGFGWAAWQRYERQAPPRGYPRGADTPHVLQPRRSVKAHGAAATTMQMGVFCDLCHSNANACYWHCGYCNEGEWGFCNACVVQAKHCTHPLLALAFSEPLPVATGTTTTAEAPALTPLPTSTSCNICSFAIPPSQTHFHCPECNAGDYDVCGACYAGFVASGRIAKADGPRGWRRCPQGHRMLVLGFVEDGQAQNLRRAVLEPVVGGWSLDQEVELAAQSRATKQDDGTPPLPLKIPTGSNMASTNDVRHELSADASANVLPNQGWGRRMLALWTRLPDDGEGAQDELSFPRNAELTEVKDINGDWSSGVYCRQRGLFPGPYARVLVA